jgi:hypothetical protein
MTLSSASLTCAFQSMVALLYCIIRKNFHPASESQSSRVGVFAVIRLFNNFGFLPSAYSTCPPEVAGSFGGSQQLPLVFGFEDDFFCLGLRSNLRVSACLPFWVVSYCSVENSG